MLFAHPNYTCNVIQPRAEDEIKFKKYYSMKKLFGHEINQDDRFRALTGAFPADRAYLHLSIFDATNLA